MDAPLPCVALPSHTRNLSFEFAVKGASLSGHDQDMLGALLSASGKFCSEENRTTPQQLMLGQKYVLLQVRHASSAKNE